MSRHGASITTASTDLERIPSRIKSKKILDTLIKEKESIQEPDNPSKRANVDSIIDERNYNKKKLLN